MKYLVIREYWADRKYSVGEVITSTPEEIAPLIGRCLKIKPAKKRKSENDDS